MSERTTTYAEMAARLDLRGGDLYWLPVEEESWSAKMWNGKHAGRKIERRNVGGYIALKVDGRGYKAHRVVWLLATGAWPEGEIDHINGEKTDNRVENLRVVNRSMNSRNVAKRRDNTSGAAGVTFHARKNRWQATICVEGQRQHLGTFITFDAALSARSAAVMEHGFTERHGK